MKHDGLLELKRQWLPLFVLGAAIFGAGIALALLWLYRQSPFTDAVVDFLTPASPEAPPRGTLISITAALFTVVGGLLLIISIRRINASEVGEIDSFWWKVAVAALAGQWWLGEPRLVVLAPVPDAATLLRALRTFSGRITVLGQPTVELVLALAEDERAVRKVLDALTRSESEVSDFGNVGDVDAQLLSLSDGLRLRGRFLPPEPIPMTLDAIAHADALVCAPNLDRDAFGFNVGDQLASAIKKMRGRKILIARTAASRAESLTQAAQWCAAHFGATTILANNNSVLPLPDGKFYQKVEAAVERDLVDWSAPERWDAAKLAVFLREVILRAPGGK